MTRCAGVPLLRGGIINKDCTRNEDQRATQRVVPLGKIIRMLWKQLEKRQEGNKQIKVLVGRLPLCPRNKWTSRWTSGRPRQREDREAKIQILRRVTENQDLDLVEGSTTSEI
jgi:hypothetical protein